MTTKLKPCPECGCPDELTIDSSSWARASWIDCHDCDYHFKKSCPEESIAKHWNKIDRQKMPVYVEPT